MTNLTSCTYLLDENQTNILFQAIREKNDVVTFWMEVVKLILSYVEPNSGQISGKMFVCTDKMNRIFVQSKSKIFSTSLPFVIRKEDENTVCVLKSGVKIDNKLSSDVIAALSSNSSLSALDFFWFAQDITDTSDDPHTLWGVLSELFRVRTH